MSEAALSADDRPRDAQGIGGHPRGLMVLFFTEMWERFSYYGMRALLLLYMTAPASQGGLGYPLSKAGLIYGAYTFCVYAAGVPGGWIADRFLGQRRAVFVGGCILAAGHLALALPSIPVFFGGLVLIIVGTGMLKTNCATLVGQLYGEGDPRRDTGFSIYYVGINLGAFLAPLVCGFLAQSETFLRWLERSGFSAHSSWHWGFGAAGAAMIVGLVQYRLQEDKLGNAGLRTRAARRVESRDRLNRDELRRLAVVAVLFLFATLFWGIYEQAGSTLTLFAADHTDCRIGGWTFPSTWYQSIPSLFLFFLAPLLGWVWLRLGSRGPTSPIKMAAGVFLVGLGMLLLLPAARLIDADAATRAGPGWLMGVYFLHTVGEVCLSPVGLSLVSRLAPARLGGVTMGVWYLTNAFGNLQAGFAASLLARLTLTQTFGAIFAMTTGATLILLALNPTIRRLTGDIR